MQGVDILKRLEAIETRLEDIETRLEDIEYNLEQNEEIMDKKFSDIYDKVEAIRGDLNSWALR